MKKVVIKQNPEEPIAVEVLAKAIIDLDKGVKRIQAAGLTNRAIALLLRDAIPRPLNLTDIMMIMDYLPKLSAIYMKRSS